MCSTTGRQEITTLLFLEFLSSGIVFEHGVSSAMYGPMSNQDPKGIDGEWLALFERAGVNPSYRALAAKTDHQIDHTRARRVILGLGTTDEAITAVASALGTTREVIQQLRGEEPSEPFELPNRARRLSRRQREAIIAVVDAMLEGLPDDVEVGTDPEVVAAHDRVAARLKGIEESDQGGEVSQGRGR